MARVTISIDEGLLEEIDDRRGDVPRSAWFQQAAADRLEKTPPMERLEALEARQMLIHEMIEDAWRDRPTLSIGQGPSDELFERADELFGT